MSIPEELENLLLFWFGESSKTQEQVIADKSQLWWGKDESLDQEVISNFSELLQPDKYESLLPAQKNLRGHLGLIILFDQIPRVVFRGKPEAFAFDTLALELASSGVAEKKDSDLRLIERTFFYLPFEHSELALNQECSVKLFQTLLAESTESLKDSFQTFLDYAIAHQKVIQQFGRYPHRNAILGRQSSAREIEYLNEPGSGF